MTAVTFDTLIYAKRLREAGFTEQQAEAQVETLKSVVDNNLATKLDLEKLELRLTIKVGTMLIAAVGMLTALIKLL